MDERWYLVSAEWWRGWVDYVNFWQHYAQPGAIDNEPLLQELPGDGPEGAESAAGSVRDVHGNQAVLGGQPCELQRSPALKEVEDYVLTCANVWGCIQSWCEYTHTILTT